MKFKPHDYQRLARNFLLANPKSALFADMGLGKTAIILDMLDELFFNRLEISKALIIAPLQVTYNVWPNEIEKWHFSKDVPYHILHGKGRVNPVPDVPLVVTNYDTIPWIYNQHNVHQQFDCIIFDESTFIKNHGTQRFKMALAMWGAVDRIHLLTGTPAPNTLLDLWGQIYFIDHGASLGRTYTDFMHHYFVPPLFGGVGYSRWKPRRDAMKEITNKISRYSITLRREDWGSIPDVDYQTIKVKLPNSLMKQYQEFEREFVTEITNTTVTAFNSAALGTKLRQFAQGFLYSENGDGTRKAEWIHDEKIKMLKDIITSNRGTRYLIAINFRAEADRIVKEFPEAEVIHGGTPHGRRPAIINKWNSGRLNILVAHPQSLGHGVNLQAGGNNIIWTGPPWNLEHWLQFNARLDRQGQKKKVCVTTLVASNTKDVVVARALRKKDITQKDLLRRLTK